MPHFMVDEPNFHAFHREWKRIGREWRSGLTIEMAQTPGMLDAIRLGIDSARAELCEQMRAIAQHCPGPYLVSV